MNRYIKRLIVWYYKKTLPTPIRYVAIQSLSRPVSRFGIQNGYEVLGWIPSPILEKITGRSFVEGRHDFLSKCESEKAKSHPLYVPHELVWEDKE